jgi:hypothetical protein
MVEKYVVINTSLFFLATSRLWRWRIHDLELRGKHLGYGRPHGGCRCVAGDTRQNFPRERSNKIRHHMLITYTLDRIVWDWNYQFLGVFFNFRWSSPVPCPSPQVVSHEWLVELGHAIAESCPLPISQRWESIGMRAPLKQTTIHHCWMWKEECL